MNAAILCQTAVLGQICNLFCFLSDSYVCLFMILPIKVTCLHQYCMSLLFSSCILLCGAIFLTGKIFNPTSQCDPRWWKKKSCISFVFNIKPKLCQKEIILLWMFSKFTCHFGLCCHQVTVMHPTYGLVPTHG